MIELCSATPNIRKTQIRTISLQTYTRPASCVISNIKNHQVFEADVIKAKLIIYIFLKLSRTLK